MGIIDIIIDNILTILLGFGLSILVITNHNFDKRSNRYFVSFIVIVFMLVIADMADYYMSGFVVLNNIRYFTSAVGYTLRPASIAIVINILLRRKKFNIAVWIPTILVSIFTFTSKYTHAVFWFDVQNNFRRGTLGYFPHIVSCFYLIILIIKIIRTYRHLDFGEVFIVFYISFACTLTTILESIYSIKFLLPGVMMISCILYYTILYTQSFKRDTLTGVLNRRSFFSDCEKWNHLQYALVSMDLNGLKDINDTYGHQEGDLALRTFADTMLVTAGKNYLIYRIGGDEFIALGKGQSQNEVEHFIEISKQELNKTKYMASFGYAIHLEYDKVDIIFNEADAKMYEDKQRYKHRTIKS